MIKKNITGKFRLLILSGIIAATFTSAACNTTTLTSIIEDKVSSDNSSEDFSLIREKGNQGEENISIQKESEIESMDVTDMFSDKDLENDYEESECTIINLDKESIDGDGAEVTSEGIKITGEGEYILTGKYKNKKITVEADESAKVRLILKDASIENEQGAAIDIKSADKVFITLAKSSTNTITGVSQKISEDEETDAAIYSKSDLTINGEGKLSVICTDGKGIVSKDDLKIISGNIDVDSSDHALSGKDSVRIAGGTIRIKAGEDGIHSGNDEDAEKGYVYIAGGDIEIDASDDGIHAETKTVIADGVINIINSEEGIEGAIVEIAGGEVNVNSGDDGINATDGLGSSGFNGFKQGDIKQEDFKQGKLEQGELDRGEFNRGDFDPSQFNNLNKPEDENFQFGKVAPDGFKDGKDENHRKPDFEDNVSVNTRENDASIDLTQQVYVLISGGKISVNAKGDGIDSNGSVYITGGSIIINGPENDANAALDYDTKAVITRGSVIAIGSDGMAMNFTGSTQGCLLLRLSTMHDAGEEIIVKDENSDIIFQYTSLSKFESILLSSEYIEEGKSYTISVGNKKQNVTMGSLILNCK